MHLFSIAFACATCMPDQGTDVANATSTAIFFLVAVIGAVLSVILGVIIRFALRQHKFAQSNA